ncbi:MAG: MMPL family transporter [Gammaproteobacteria bacterium]|nr:MMPL family transporter [Gammaproteobacteria bacterium]
MKDATKHHLTHPVEDVEPMLEKLFFKNRIALIIFFVLVTVFLAFQAAQIKPDASFEKMVPTFHPYIANFLKNRDDLASLGNSVRIVVETRHGDIFDKDFQELLKEINDEVFFIPGVDRSKLESLWSPNIRWSEVTEEGFRGGSVIPDDYDGSSSSLEQLRENVLKSGQIGRLVANNFKSTIVLAPLVDRDAETGEKLDYKKLSESLETLVRDKYSSDTVSIHIIGFAKIVGDLINGASQVGMFFGIAFLTTMMLLYMYSRCVWSTIIPLLCSTMGVVWQLGLLNVLGFGIDPYSMLVPFLVFAIGVSHGVQMINSIRSKSLFGASPMAAARLTFRQLYVPGLVALASDGIGFLTLIVIEIPVIQELALTASLGVAVLILTNLVLLPVLMSYTGVSKGSMRYMLANKDKPSPVWQWFAGFAEMRRARVTLLIAVGLFGFGLYFGQDLKIGDLDPGAPELRADSRYNMDNAFLTANYSNSTDVFVVMVETPPQQCGDYDVVAAIDRFQGEMETVEGVQSVVSLVNVAKLYNTAMNEGSLKWASLSRNKLVLNSSLSAVPNILINTDCSMVPVLVFLEDHKADTLTRVIGEAESFATSYNSPAAMFLLAAGNSGVEAATNVVIGTAQYQMLAWVYGVVSLLCLITFRSLRAVLCVMLPLALTSVLAQALMAFMGIGVKVATLPVIALGVGIGVDYGIYIYSKLVDYIKMDLSLAEAYFKTLQTTGVAVAFTGLTLAIGVGTWMFSPIKFQADMGLMLTFMFLWNMLGALVLLPALSRMLLQPEKIRQKARDEFTVSATEEPES